MEFNEKHLFVAGGVSYKLDLSTLKFDYKNKGDLNLNLDIGLNKTLYSDGMVLSYNEIEDKNKIEDELPNFIYFEKQESDKVPIQFTNGKIEFQRDEKDNVEVTIRFKIAGDKIQHSKIQHPELGG